MKFQSWRPPMTPHRLPHHVFRANRRLFQMDKNSIFVLLKSPFFGEKGGFSIAVEGAGSVTWTSAYRFSRLLSYSSELYILSKSGKFLEYTLCMLFATLFLQIVISASVIQSTRSATVNLDWNRNVGNQGTTTINVGDTVTWTWTEGKQHQVRSMGLPSFTSSSVVSTNGYVYSITFTSSGSYSYDCSIHPSMEGVINVVAITESPTVSPTRAPTKPPTSPPTSLPSMHSETIQPTTPPPTPAPTLTTQPSLAPTTTVPTLAPSTQNPTSQPTALPTLDVSKLLENELLDLPVISSGSDSPSAWDLTLTVKAHRHSNVQVAFTTRSYCVNGTCSYPGPIIRILPGDNFTLTLVNELGAETNLSSPHLHNSIHSPNTTNVHTHGLHIDPNVDNVFVKAGPGESLVYKYRLPTDHAPGLHWYHAHFHGSSALQLMGGLAGALVVEQDASNAPQVPASLRNADSRVMVVTKLMLGQETSDGEVSQGCGEDWTCDADTQGPLCTGMIFYIGQT